MKKLIYIAAVAAACAFSANAANGNISVMLDGKTLEFEQPPVIVEERTLVPLRAIFESLGADVEWDDETKTVTSVKDDVTVKMTIGDSAFEKNGEKLELDVPAQIVGDGYTMVPARAVAESFGVDVKWEDDTKTVVLTSPKKEKETIEGAVIYEADAESEEEFYGLYSSGAEKLKTVNDPHVDGNRVYFLDANVNNRASWTYIWVDAKFEAGETYYIEYDAMIGEDVFGNDVGKVSLGTCFKFAESGSNTATDHGVAFTTFEKPSVWQRISQIYTVPSDANTDIAGRFGVFASPIDVDGYDHQVAVDFYIDNLSVVPADKMPEGVISVDEAKNAYFYGTTTKNPLEYKAGETMTFKLCVIESAKKIVEVPYIFYSCVGDDGKENSGFAEASEDGYFYFDTKCESDGFVRVTAKVCDENKRVLNSFKIFEGGAGADIDKIKCDTTKPADYDEYWEKLKKTAYSLKNEVIYEKDMSDGSFVIKDVRLKTAEGAGEYASFIITYPQNAATGSLKLKMIFMGYGVNAASANRNEGYITISMNSHDIPNDLPSKEYQELSNTRLKSYGWIESENAAPETSYWQKMYIRNFQVYNYAISNELFDGKTVEFQGSSQGGFQACNMAAHTDGKATLCKMNAPWFANLAGKSVGGRIDGWLPDPLKHPATAYFDTAIAASYVKCKTEIDAGLGDYTTPPSGIMAIYNNLLGEKSIRFVQNRTHSYAPASYYDYLLSSR